MYTANWLCVQAKVYKSSAKLESSSLVILFKIYMYACFQSGYDDWQILLCVDINVHSIQLLCLKLDTSMVSMSGQFRLTKISDGTNKVIPSLKETAKHELELLFLSVHVAIQ